MRTFDLDQFWPSLSMRSVNSGAAPGGPGTAAETLTVSSPRDAPAGALRTNGSGAALEGFALDVAPPIYQDTRPQRMATVVARCGARAIRFVRGFDPKAAIWLSMGFVAGMVAWHAVGFWGFVSAAVLNAPAAPTAVAETAPVRPKVNFKSIITTTGGAETTITTGSLATFSAQPNLCVALAVDRATGATVANTCGLDGQPMRDAGRRRRADRMPGIDARLQNAGSWATDTQSTAPSARPSQTSSSVTDTDFDLTLASD